MSWDKYIKRYVWDDTKTPYFVSVGKLNRIQADHELFAFTVFITLLFAIVSIISLTEHAPHGKSPTVAFYTLSVALGAVLLGVTKHVYPAYYLAMAPLVTLVYFLLGGFPPNLAEIDRLVITIVTLALLRYSMRVVAIAKRYQDMPEDPSNG